MSGLELKAKQRLSPLIAPPRVSARREKQIFNLFSSIRGSGSIRHSMLPRELSGDPPYFPPRRGRLDHSTATAGAPSQKHSHLRRAILSELQWLLKKAIFSSLYLSFWGAKHFRVKIPHWALDHKLFWTGKLITCSLSCSKTKQSPGVTRTPGVLTLIWTHHKVSTEFSPRFSTVCGSYFILSIQF